MRRFFEILMLSYSLTALGQGADPSPLEFEFYNHGLKKAANFTGTELFFGRNTSDNLDRNFASLVINNSNWSMVKVRPKIKVFSQFNRTDEIYLKGGGNGKMLLSSVTGDLNWNPDTLLSFNKSQLGIEGHQDYGLWVDYTTSKRSIFTGFRIRTYSNIYKLCLDTGVIGNTYTSNLMVGNQYFAYGSGYQLFMESNSSNLETLLTNPLNFLWQTLSPSNMMILLDYQERIKVSSKVSLEYRISGIPFLTLMESLRQRNLDFQWDFKGLNISNLDSSFSRDGVKLDSTIDEVQLKLNSKNSPFKPSKSLNIGLKYEPSDALEFQASYTYSSQHFYSNSDLAMRVISDHGENLKLMIGLHSSSQFGVWTESSVYYRPLPHTTIYMKAAGLDAISFKESLELKKNFRILQVSIGLLANL